MKGAGGDVRRLSEGCKFRILVSIHVTCDIWGSKKAWAKARLVSFRGLIENFRRASPPHMGVSPACLLSHGPVA